MLLKYREVTETKSREREREREGEKVRGGGGGGQKLNCAVFVQIGLNTAKIPTRIPLLVMFFENKYTGV